MPTRRTFLLAGLAGTAALVAAGWLRSTRVAPGGSGTAQGAAPLSADANDVLSAVIPVFLAGALPVEQDAAKGALRETMASVGVAIAGLQPAAQRELAQLFSLLGFAPARVALTGIYSAWGDAGSNDVAAFLERWRTSSFLMFRSGYAALHQLVFAAWYGNPESWAAIGYPGPPKLSA